MDVKADGGAVWSGGKDAGVVRWDERSRTPATKIKGGFIYPLGAIYLKGVMGRFGVLISAQLLYGNPCRSCRSLLARLITW